MAGAPSPVPGMSLPPISAGGGGPSSTGAQGQGASWAFDGSGMTVNYAPSIGVGAAASIPSWVWIGAAVVGAIWMLRR